MLDFARYDRQRMRVGVTDAEVARAAGIAPITISRARHGRTRLRESTFKRIAVALSTFPVPRGADALLEPDPEAPPAIARSHKTKSSTAPSSVELMEVSDGGTSTDACPR